MTRSCHSTWHQPVLALALGLCRTGDADEPLRSRRPAPTRTAGTPDG